MLEAKTETKKKLKELNPDWISMQEWQELLKWNCYNVLEILCETLKLKVETKVSIRNIEFQSRLRCRVATE